MTKPPINLVFLWHMHQPDYRNHIDGEIVLPWTLLHSLKDYSDMAYHLEINPKMRAVVNFVPVLCEQIADYQEQFQSRNFRLPLLKLLAEKDYANITIAEKKYLLETCFAANEQNMIKPFFAYNRLWEISQKMLHANDINYLAPSYFGDIVTWYFLAWLGESVRRSDSLFQLLVDKSERGDSFSYDDRARLMLLIASVINNLLPRYRALQERGQIEISTTPNTHPLAPLLLDFNSARESEPNAPLPQNQYPSGAERVRLHLHQSEIIHQKYFGKQAPGLWPAEGAISDDFIKLINQNQQTTAHKVRWIASGEGVLRNSLALSKITCESPAYTPWRLGDVKEPIIFFRDERLSDLIGFEYSRWHNGDAARHLVRQIEEIYDKTPADKNQVVAIILDGENAWEHYPFNGYYFFECLYKILTDNPKIHITTFNTICDEVSKGAIECRELPQIADGSWVYGTMSTWIGDAEKNHAWDLLVSAKNAYDAKINLLSPAKAEKASEQLAICESSDWFWWFGNYNPSHSVTSFDKLYRQNLTLLYKAIEVTPPPELLIPISTGNNYSTADGTMRKVS